MSTTYDYAPQYNIYEPEALSYSSLGNDPMNEDDKETFNMQCNIALLNMVGNPMQSRNGMMCIQPLPSDSDDYMTTYPDLSYDQMCGLDPSPFSSTSTSPSNFPLYPTAGHPGSQNIYTQNLCYRNTDASAYKHKRVEELAKSPRPKSKQQSHSHSSSSSQKGRQLLVAARKFTTNTRRANNTV